MFCESGPKCVWSPPTFAAGCNFSPAMRWEDVLGKFNGRRNEDYVKRMGGEIPGDGEGTGGGRGSTGASAPREVPQTFQPWLRL